MKQVLVTGATGNIGQEVVQSLCQLELAASCIVAARNTEKAQRQFAHFPALNYRLFDFEDQQTFHSAFYGIDVLFLLRPPHISKVEEYFMPLLRSAWDCGIRKVVFLSVQGAEKSKVIPHNQIEALIRSFGFDYIFVRPSYFMQNLTTTLFSEIQETRSITLPAGKAVFNWIDVKDIGKVCATLINTFDSHKNQAFEITGTENKNFEEVAALMSSVMGFQIRYHSINPISFYLSKRKRGVESGFAIVMSILHFLPRFQKEPEISGNYKMLTGQEPTVLKEFVLRERSTFLKR
jgi:uncharacterized protein YbjT (DUF2867 family)